MIGNSTDGEEENGITLKRSPQEKWQVPTGNKNRVEANLRKLERMGLVWNRVGLRDHLSKEIQQTRGISNLKLQGKDWTGDRDLRLIVNTQKCM